MVDTVTDTTSCSHSEKKTMKTRIVKNICNKSERRCRDVKTKKTCKQGWEANVGPKIKETTSIYST